MSRLQKNQTAELYRRMDQIVRLKTKVTSLNIKTGKDLNAGRYSVVNRRREEMAKINAEIKRLRELNERDEWICYRRKTGSLITLAEFRNRLRYGGGNWYPKAA